MEDLTAHLQSTRQQLEENERIKLSLAEDKAHIERVRHSTTGKRERVSFYVLCGLQTLSQMNGFRDELETSLQKTRLALEDTRQENTELISKVCANNQLYIPLLVSCVCEVL